MHFGVAALDLAFSPILPWPVLGHPRLKDSTVGSFSSIASSFLGSGGAMVLCINISTRVVALWPAWRKKKPLSQSMHLSSRHCRVVFTNRKHEAKVKWLLFASSQRGRECKQKQKSKSKLSGVKTFIRRTARFIY